MEEESEEVELMEVNCRSDKIKQRLATLSFPELINTAANDAIASSMDERMAEFFKEQGFSMFKWHWSRLVRDVAATKNAEYAERLRIVRAANNEIKRAEAAVRRARVSARKTKGPMLVGQSSLAALSNGKSSVKAGAREPLSIKGQGSEVSLVACDGQLLDVESLSIADLHRFAEVLQSLGHSASTLSTVKNYHKLVNTVYKASKAIISLRTLMPA